MDEITSEQVLAALRRVRHPRRDGDVVGLGMVSGVVVKDGNVGFAVEVDPAEAPELEPLRRACEQAVRSLPGVISCTAVLNRGMAGQKIRLPSTTSTAGNSVSMATSAHRMPAAPIGPNPLVLFRSATSRQSRPAITVAADATMAGAAPRSAWTIATRTFSWWCSASRYRAMSNSA